MSTTFLKIKDFIEEVKRWGIPSSSMKTRVRAMLKGNNCYFRFFIPNSSEVIGTVITKKQYEEFWEVELASISVSAIWEEESEQINFIVKKLEDLNAKFANINRRDSKGLELEFT